MQKNAYEATAGKLSRQPGTEGLWTFIFIDMVIFLLIFIVFMGERMRRFDLFSASQHHLNELFGLANTLILLTSSWMVVEAIRAAKKQLPKKVSFYLWATLLLGFAFAINKLIEYHAKFDAGINPATNPFYSFYFFITIVHFLHVLAGMIFLFSFRKDANACATPERTRYVTGLENVGLFWHYVDILWIFIFPLLYLVGRQ
jgi:nitric oxide reductase NorE protein